MPTCLAFVRLPYGDEMPRKARPITVDLLPIETVSAEHPCPWIRATEVLIKAAERLGLPLDGEITQTIHVVNPPYNDTVTATSTVAL